MSYLLDTHVFLWHIDGNSKLDKKIISLVEDPSNEIFISIASFWEIVIKKAIRKLKAKHTIDNLKQYLLNQNFSILNISLEHLQELEKLPFIHHDPFDRIIIAQAISEGYSLVSDDPQMKKYNVRFV